MIPSLYHAHLSSRAGYFLYLTCLTIGYFLKREVTVVFSAPLEQPMIFPAVTVCNLNAYRKDDLEAIGFCIPAEMYDEVNVTSI